MTHMTLTVFFQPLNVKKISAAGCNCYKVTIFLEKLQLILELDLLLSAADVKAQLDFHLKC